MCKCILSHNKIAPHRHTHAQTCTHTYPSFEMSQSNIIKLRMQREINLHTFLHFFNYALILSGLRSNNFYQLISQSGFDAQEGVRRFTNLFCIAIKISLLKGH